VFENGSRKLAVEILATYKASNATTATEKLWVSLLNRFTKSFPLLGNLLPYMLEHYELQFFCLSVPYQLLVYSRKLWILFE